MDRSVVLSLIATLTLGAGLGAAVTYQITSHVEATCQNSPPATAGIPPGFFKSTPLPLTGERY